MMLLPALFFAIFTIGSFSLTKSEPVEIKAEEIEHAETTINPSGVSNSTTLR